ncbi:MAG: diguanylate cyclase, partial [Planctomycetota bacterium]
MIPNDSNDVAGVPQTFRMIPSVAGMANNADAWQSNQVLSKILNLLPVKIFWKDHDLLLRGCNSAFCVDAGIDRPNDIVGLSDFELPWTDAEAEYYRSCDRQIMQSRQAVVGMIETQTSADGETSWVETSKIPLTDGDGRVVGIVGVYHDVTGIKRSEQELQIRHDELAQSNDELEARVLHRTKQLQHLAQHDHLTGLANRGHFVQSLDNMLVTDDEQFALLFVDLDRFKSINDTMGHKAGDELLVQVSQILRDSVRPGDVVGRFGGDEFVLLIRDLKNEAEVLAISERIQRELRRNIVVEQCSLLVTASIGIVVESTGRYRYASDVLRDADIAMYEAKGQGKARHQLFNGEMLRRVRDRMEMENEMRAGLLREEFSLRFQPICNHIENRLSGFEALIRWQHPTRGLLAPNSFLDLAEESGLIVELGTSVLHQSCQELARWRREIPELATHLSVNF